MKRWKLHLLMAFLAGFLGTSCNDGTTGQTVIEVGDSFQAANDAMPEGTVFLVRAGVHKSQTVHNPKSGNRWIGENGATLDGESKITAAFTGSANDITIQGITIENYVDNGIFFQSGSNIDINRIIVRDTGSGNGEKNGAVRLDRVSDFKVRNSHFSRVVSAIIPSYCTGPALVENNTGVNTGRNFVQFDKCSGAGIIIRNNVMERLGDYLRGEAFDVVDWISIYDSEGTPESPIHIYRNRAKGHGFDRTGSFIMLGDDGGKYQLAEENIGVNPGQVGIGIAGGEEIVVRGNILYSNETDFSNVALYSADYSNNYKSLSADTADFKPCSNHVITRNRSYWTDGQRQNNVWTDHRCEPVIEDNIYPDNSINENIWYKTLD